MGSKTRHSARRAAILHQRATTLDCRRVVNHGRPAALQGWVVARHDAAARALPGTICGLQRGARTKHLQALAARVPPYHGHGGWNRHDNRGYRHARDHEHRRNDNGYGYGHDHGSRTDQQGWGGRG